MIKENNRKIILGFASLSFALGILFRLIYGGFNNVSTLYENLYYIITFVFFFITFFKQKNQKIDLLLLICVIALAQSIYIRRVLFFYWNYFFYIIAIILVIVIMLKVVRTIKQLNIIKIISIGLLTLSYFRIIYLNITLYSNPTAFLISVSYFFTLVAMVLLIVQLDPSKLNIIRPTKIVYISLCYNLFLLVIHYISFYSIPRHYDLMFFDNRYVFYRQLIYLLIVLAIQWILLFYNKNIFSYIFTILTNLLILLYAISYVITYNKFYIIPFIILMFGIGLNILLIIKEKKNKEIIQD